MSIEEDLERIVNLPGSKADRARALFALGCDKRDVVELLDMAYSQAHSIWVKGDFVGNDGQPGRSKAGRDSHSGNVGQSEGFGGWETEPRTSPRSRKGGSRFLHLSPTQTRYITQSTGKGRKPHVVVRVDRTTGAFCGACDDPVTFDLRYLGFVHTNSKAIPTDIEDRYVD